jgi:hypothetical protein
VPVLSIFFDIIVGMWRGLSVLRSCPAFKGLIMMTKILSPTHLGEQVQMTVNA